MIPLPLTRRDVAREDEPFLRALYASTREDELSHLEWPESVLEAFLRLQYDARAADYRRRHPEAVQHLLLVDGEPSGRLWVDRAAEAWTVLDIALLPALRGLGFGTHCLQELLAEATAAGVPVLLHVNPANPARRLYERLGFDPDYGGGDEMDLALRWSPAPFLLRSGASLSSMEP